MANAKKKAKGTTSGDKEKPEDHKDWTQRAIQYLIDNPKFRIRLFSDSTVDGGEQSPLVTAARDECGYRREFEVTGGGIKDGEDAVNLTAKIQEEWSFYKDLHRLWSELPNYNPIGVTTSFPGQDFAGHAASLFTKKAGDTNISSGIEDNTLSTYDEDDRDADADVSEAQLDDSSEGGEAGISDKSDVDELEADLEMEKLDKKDKRIHKAREDKKKAKEKSRGNEKAKSSATKNGKKTFSQRNPDHLETKDKDDAVLAADVVTSSPISAPTLQQQDAKQLFDDENPDGDFIPSGARSGHHAMSRRQQSKAQMQVEGDDEEEPRDEDCSQEDGNKNGCPTQACKNEIKDLVLYVRNRITKMLADHKITEDTIWELATDDFSFSHHVEHPWNLFQQHFSLKNPNTGGISPWNPDIHYLVAEVYTGTDPAARQDCGVITSSILGETILKANPIPIGTILDEIRDKFRSSETDMKFTFFMAEGVKRKEASNTKCANTESEAQPMSADQAAEEVVFIAKANANELQSEVTTFFKRRLATLAPGEVGNNVKWSKLAAIARDHQFTIAGWPSVIVASLPHQGMFSSTQPTAVWRCLVNSICNKALTIESWSDAILAIWLKSLWLCL
ncbi:hypothetical protein GALMADRAFT_138022 [Galerina marginata CBS 339.88]|uniref:Uncharacterized protein n=1 Tax=Galerina marginata (strain CBS 339.88) TaxID=685588 RepID=A0A067T7A5_GALM3|nr:hypothetical protein GALMADRAFT_138022 [Galerina marginata CBS 339.88]